MTISPSRAVELAQMGLTSFGLTPLQIQSLCDFILAAPPAPVAQEDVIGQQEGERLDALAEEIENLRSDLARVTKERDEADAVICMQLNPHQITDTMFNLHRWTEEAIARHAAPTQGEG